METSLSTTKGGTQFYSGKLFLSCPTLQFVVERRTMNSGQLRRFASAIGKRYTFPSRLMSTLDNNAEGGVMCNRCKGERVSHGALPRGQAHRPKRVPHGSRFTNARPPSSDMNDLQTDQNMSLRETFRAENGLSQSIFKCAKPVDSDDECHRHMPNDLTRTTTKYVCRQSIQVVKLLVRSLLC